MKAQTWRIPEATAALALYLGGGWLSVEFIRSADDVALIWLPSGIALALMILAGVRALPLIAGAMLLVHLLLVPVEPLFLFYSILANTLGALAGWRAFVALGGRADARLSVRAGLHVLIGAAVLATVSASIGSLGLIHSGQAATADAGSVFLAWALGDLFGVIALTSTLLLLVAMLRRRYQPGRRPSLPQPQRSPVEYAFWAALSLGVLMLLFGAGAASGAQALGLSGLPVTMLLWSAIRFPPLFTFIGTSALALAVASVTGLGMAGFSTPSGAVESAVLVGFLCVTMVAPQVLASAIHENRVSALRLLRRALRDPLTGLPNRAAFDEDLRRSLADPSGRPLLVAYLDLDQFKIINDTLSHAAGDALLGELAGVIRAELPAHGALYRIGGDEFALLLPSVEPQRAAAQLENLCECVADFRFAWAAGLVSTRVSIGYAVVTDLDTDAGMLLAQIDTACFTAKELGGGRVQRAAPGELAVRERTSAMHWVMRINSALEHDRFELFCQAIEPLGEAAEGLHFEILLRKRDADSQELLLPAEFIAAAERFGLSARIDTHVVERTLQWLERHPQQAERVQLCSINLSAGSLLDAGFARFLRERLQRSSFPASRLCFEITETGAVRDLAQAADFIHSLRALGCRFALDDFGTGFCSFSYLPKLEVEILKIDGSFVREAEQSALALAIVQAIVQIARVTGRQTVAEWVETPALAERMRELGVDYAQGYAFSHPMPIAEFFAQRARVPAGSDDPTNPSLSAVR